MKATASSLLPIDCDLSQASRSLQNSLQTVYEDGWPDKQEFQDQMKNFDLLWNDYLQSLQDSVINPTNKFLQHFPTFKTKIAKRGRKLVDYDNARHQVDVLQAAKKKDEVKIEKAQEDLKEAKRIYEEINHELLTEMPDFNNSRCHFFATLMTGFFGTEFLFHSEIGKVNASLGDTCQKLANQSEPMTVNLKLNMSVSATENGMKGENSSGPSTPVSPSGMSSKSKASDNQDPEYTNQATLEQRKALKEAAAAHVNGDGDEDSDNSEYFTMEPREPPVYPPKVEDSISKVDPEALEKSLEASEKSREDDDEDDDYVNSNIVLPPTVKQENSLNHYEEPMDAMKENGKNKLADDDSDDSDDDDNDDDDDNEPSVYTEVPSNKPVYTPPEGTMYQVQATHRYAGEDVDELNFDAGEIIYVIACDDPNEQDDGWQMGIKQSDGIKGFFPENFTKKI